MTKRKTKMIEDQYADTEPVEAEPVVAVTVIHEQGPTALVQWAEGRDMRRAFVPTAVVHDGHVAQDELNAGIPYGVRWEQFITITGTPDDVGYELRRRNIWTLRDLEGRYREAQVAFLSAFGADIGAMLQAVRKVEA